MGEIAYRPDGQALEKALEKRFSEMFPCHRVTSQFPDLPQPINDLLVEAAGKGFSLHKWNMHGSDADKLECINAAKSHLEIKDMLLELEYQRRILYDAEYPLPQYTITIIWSLSIVWTLTMWFIVVYFALHLDTKPEWANGGLLSACAKSIGDERLSIPEDLSESWIAQSLPPEWLEGLTFPDHWGMSTRLLVSTVFSMFYNWILMDPLFHMWVVMYKLVVGHGILRCKCRSYADKANDVGDKWNAYRYYFTLDKLLERMLKLARGPRLGTTSGIDTNKAGRQGMV